MALEEDLAEIKEKRETISSRKTRAQVEIENATTRRDAARTSLKEEFGVTTSADARTKLAELKENVATSIASVREELENAGA